MRCAIYCFCSVRAIGLLSVLFVTTQSIAQKDYFHFRVTWPLHGTPYLIKESYRRLGFDDTQPASDFIWHTNAKSYPRSAHYPGINFEYGRHITEKTSLSLLAGIEEGGVANGFDTYKRFINFKFTNWVANTKINFHSKGFVFGVGPSVLLMSYNVTGDRLADYYESKLLPGLGISVGNVPVKKPDCKLTVFVSLNLHSGFETEKLYFTDNLQPAYFQTRVNPTNFLIGLCFKL